LARRTGRLAWRCGQAMPPIGPANRAASNAAARFSGPLTWRGRLLIPTHTGATSPDNTHPEFANGYHFSPVRHLTRFTANTVRSQNKISKK
ncbi:hypothetical protein, partial [Ralstonia pseudosolanacearum]|uniref:hypothetical protein n=1 Tax=Ralstonia pseudosolanacearum TaxID=1310165 RepID=UPI003221D5E3